MIPVPSANRPTRGHDSSSPPVFGILGTPIVLPGRATIFRETVAIRNFVDVPTDAYFRPLNLVHPYLSGPSHPTRPSYSPVTRKTTTMTTQDHLTPTFTLTSPSHFLRKTLWNSSPYGLTVAPNTTTLPLTKPDVRSLSEISGKGSVFFSTLAKGDAKSFEKVFQLIYASN